MNILGIVDLPLWFILVVAVIVAFYLYMKNVFGKFVRLGIPGPTPIPLMGNMHTFLKEGMMKYDLNLKKKYGNVIGTYIGSRANLVIFDEEMISQVTVKQFQNFTNRQTEPSGEDLFDLSILILRDEEWKHMRNVISPAFTTGKLKLMCKEINRCSQQLVKVLAGEAEFDSKNKCGDFTMSVIASVAFGLRVNCLEEKDNVFIKHGKALLDFNLKNPLLWLFVFFPPVQRFARKYFGYSIMDADASNFFRQVLRQTVEGQSKDATKASANFIQMMANAKKGEDIRDEEEKKEGSKSSDFDFTQDHIIANAFLFFLAGYETTSQGLSLLLYNLADYPECQEKLHQEILQHLPEDMEDVDYNTVSKMTYLDQCIQESLRIYPPGPRIDRLCKQDTEVCGIKISKGMSVVVPVYALHHDPDVYPEPEKFDPDRFSPEQKAGRNNIYWMPFGSGPRNCIGLRLATFEIKVATIQILRRHRIVVTKKPKEFDKLRWLRTKEGIWLKLVPRE